MQSPTGAFSLVTRKDGTKQWAYDEHALYTSYLDKVPGDVMAATTSNMGSDGPAAREVATAPSAHSARFPRDFDGARPSVAHG